MNHSANRGRSRRVGLLWMVLLLGFALLFGGFAATPALAATATSWQDMGNSDDAQWRIDADGVLYIRPKSSTANYVWYSGSDAPWSDQAAEITAVKITGACRLSSGVSRLFAGCSQLKEIDLSNLSGDAYSDPWMFEGCSSLTKITVSSDLIFVLGNGEGGWKLDFPVPDGNYTGRWLSSADGRSYEYDEIPSGVAATYTAQPLTDGWSRIGTCEWQIDDAGKLTIRPLAGESVGCVETDDHRKYGWTYANDWPWYDKRTSIKSVAFEGSVELVSPAYMFYECTKLTSVDLSGISAGSASSMYGMFSGCAYLKSVKLPSAADAGALKKVSQMFSGCKMLTSVDFGGLDFSGVTNMNGMFENCTLLRTVSIPELGANEVSMSCLFNGCTAMRTADLSFAAKASPTSMWAMFSGCTNLRSFEFPKLDWSKCQNLGYMFSGCNMLTSVNCDNLDASSIQFIIGMFSGCSRLSTLDMSMLDFKSLTNSGTVQIDENNWMTFSSENSIFSGCSSLVSLKMPKLSSGLVQSADCMFSGCEKLASIDLSGFDMSSVTDTSGMFGGCSDLKEIDLSGRNLNLLVSSGYMFSAGYNGLLKLTLNPETELNEDCGLYDDSSSYHGWFTSDGTLLADFDAFDEYRLAQSEPYTITRGVQVTFGTDASTIYDTAVIPAGTTVTRPADPTLDDMVFTGWYLNNVEFDFSTAITEDLRLFAGWEKAPEPERTDISGAVISDVSDQTYTGEPIKPAVKVTLDGVELVADADYTVAYSSNTQVGIGIVIVKGIGSYTGNAYATFKIVEPAPVPVDISGAVVADIADQAYTGAALEPEVAVSLDGVALVAGTDYEVAYGGNTEVGFATVTITGIGGYTGVKTAQFSIVPADISGAAIASIPEQTATGEPLTPGVTVALGDATLVAGTDYEVSYDNNVEAGTATVTVTGIGNYTGTVEASFDIVAPAPDPVDISGAEIAAIPDQTYTGEAIEPEVTVVLDGTVLTAGTDYEVTYKSNTQPGTAVVVVRGVGSYTGNAYATFRIVQQEPERTDISGASIAAIPDQTYTGEALTPEVEVTLDGAELTAGVDYEVTYSGNTGVGTAIVIINGIGSYTGSAYASFRIVEPAPEPVDISAATVVTIPEQIYTGEPIEPEVTVTLGDVVLARGVDYEVSYANNVQVGTATVTVAGIGGYTGSVTATFQIAEAENPEPAIAFTDVTSATAHASDIEWLADAQISTGFDNGDGTKRFEPYSEVARCDMAAFLYRLADPSDYTPSDSIKAYFSDVDEETPHYKEVLWLAEAGISKGWDVGNTHEFRPYETVKRCDMAAFLFRLAGSSDYAPSDDIKAYFSDVSEETPHYEEVLWLAEAGISQGWEVGNTHEFRPYETVKRCDMAAFLHRLCNLPEVE